MPLPAGRFLSFYEILGPLGVGAMGEVYRARDTRLGREVAIKVLPEHLAGDQERLLRFQREAKSLASLNHPNVAQIFGVDQVEDTYFLVLELVPGETLDERLARGALALDEALDLARQIAEGLEAAHEAGVIHRDLKPANVRVTPDGQVKVLDFGLAKAVARGGEVESGHDSALSTEAGRVLGTPTYMAPEQARGRPIDRRVDVWAFGCVLFECLAGQRAFGGASLTDVLAAIVKSEPAWERLPASTPAHVRALLARCLEKDPRQRLRDIGEARIALAGGGRRPETAARGRWGAGIAWGVALFALALSAWLALRPDGRSEAPRERLRLRLDLTRGGELASGLGSPVALSPDGRSLAWIEGELGRAPIRLRSLDDLSERELAGTEGAYLMSFSTDSAWLAFASAGQISKVALQGGAAVPLATGDGQRVRGLAWGEDGSLFFAPSYESGLWRLPPDGGEPVELTTPEHAAGERSHRLPVVLPGGRALVYLASRFGQPYDEGELRLLDLESGASRLLHRGGTQPGILPQGYLTFVRKRTLFAVPFDFERGELGGSEVPIVEGVAVSPANGMAMLAVSPTGMLLYVEDLPGAPDSALVRIDRSGTRTPLPLDQDDYGLIALSPDGSRLAFLLGAETWRRDLWVTSLERGSLTRLTSNGTGNFQPCWTPDGKRIVFTSARDNSVPNLFEVESDGSSNPRRLVDLPRQQLYPTLSPDGATLMYVQSTVDSDWDLWMREPREGVESRPFLQSRFLELDPRFSPDGKWLAFVCDETGESEVTVTPFPGPGPRTVVSRGGGRAPRWSQAGPELFFVEKDEVFAVPYELTSSGFEPGEPVALFRAPIHQEAAGASFDVAPDGQTFYAVVGQDSGPTRSSAVLVLGWLEELEAQAGSRRGR